MTAPSGYAAQVQNAARQLRAIGAGGLAPLFDLTSDRLVRFAVTVTRNQHDAEDCVQAVLVRVAGSPGLLAEADSSWAYLLRMVRNEALQVCRKKKWRIFSTGLCDLVTVRRVDELEREEMHRAVWRALRSLPREQAEVVALKVWEELTFAEIGRVLDVSPNTAASRYQYALPKLARLLAPHRSGAPHA